MLLDWTGEFDAWLDRLTERADRGEHIAVRTLTLVTAELEVLQELDGEPDEDTATLKRVRQSRRNQVWRVAHAYEQDVAVRLIAWFPPEKSNTVVVALFAGDKARMGDVFYDSVGTRADAAIASYLHATEGGDHD